MLKLKNCKSSITKKIYLKFQKLYSICFIKPNLEFLGDDFFFLEPWNLKLFGGPISIGNFTTIVATSDKKIWFSVWPKHEKSGRISIGKYCIICPGVRISSACNIEIADNCMLANGVYVTDCDWHGIYNRVSFGKTASVKLERNVWVGDSAIICKGVRIGENSIVGAGAVVVNSVPSNVVVAGNPAKVVKILKANIGFVTRSSYFSNLH